MIVRAISALADTVLLAPSSFLLVLYLLAWRHVRLALAFALAVLFTIVATVAAKGAFHACGGSIVDIDVTSPSGHASFATVFYGTLAMMIAAGRPLRDRVAIGFAALALLGAIGWSRVEVGAHTPSEVILGFLIGLAGTVLFAKLRPDRMRPPLWPFMAAGGLAAAFVVVTGLHLTFEHLIVRTALRATATLDICTQSAARTPRIALRPTMP